MTIDFNQAAVHEAIAAEIPNRDCIVWRGRHLSWAEVTSRTRRLANYLLSHGVRVPVEREYLDGHESGQTHLGIYLHNGNEYLECMLGAYKARVAPFNVNYRYVAEELRGLLTDASCQALVYHEAFTPMLAEILPELDLQVLLCVGDGSGHPLLPGAVGYEEALAMSSDRRPEPQIMGGDWSPDDLYILYTGGTTGMPKGVLWRQADIAVAAMSLRDAATQAEYPSLYDIARSAAAGEPPFVSLPAAPFMHGAGQWISFSAWNRGGTVVIQDTVTALVPADLCTVVARERVAMLQIVGDAFGRPVIDEIERAAADGAPYDLSSLRWLLSGGAALSVGLKQRFLAALPGVLVIDGMGSSEAGGQLTQYSAGADASTGTFPLTPGNHVLDADLTGEVHQDHDGLGWLAKSGRLPLGYLGDADKTAATFPVIGGTRYSVPGDRARLVGSPSGPIVELHGRDAVTINSGGEKIFAEEVEAALMAHPDVYDVVVAGRPSERWGHEVVAIVQCTPGREPTESDLLAEAARHVARYKLPKAFVFVDRVVRSPSGKADYRWAAAQAGTRGRMA